MMFHRFFFMSLQIFFWEMLVQVLCLPGGWCWAISRMLGFTPGSVLGAIWRPLSVRGWMSRMSWIIWMCWLNTRQVTQASLWSYCAYFLNEDYLGDHCGPPNSAKGLLLVLHLGNSADNTSHETGVFYLQESSTYLTISATLVFLLLNVLHLKG